MRLQYFTCLFSYHFDLRRIARQLVRRFEDHGQTPQGRVVQNTPEHFQPQAALPELFMPVLMRAAGVFAVVQMQRLQSVKADHAVEFSQHAVQIVYNVVSRVRHMARIEADADLILKLHPLYDFRKLFKPASDLRSLARHRLKQYRRLLLRAENPVQRLRDLLDSFSTPCPTWLPG